MKPSIKFIIVIMIGLLGSYTAGAQKYVTKNGYISFYSEAPLETIRADNDQVNAAVDIQTGDIVFKVLIMSFQFPKALMQEHFNENYLESDKYPNSIFKGKITDLSAIDFTKPGTYDATIDGDLTIHGVTNTISQKGTFTVEPGDKILGNSKFFIKPADYNIKIPATVMNNIAKSIEVTVKIELSKLSM